METDGDSWRQMETDGERWRRRGGGLPCSLQDFAAASHSCLSTELFSMPYDQITHIPHRERPNANECEYVCVLGCWRRKRRTRGREGGRGDGGRGEPEQGFLRGRRLQRANKLCQLTVCCQRSDAATTKVSASPPPPSLPHPHPFSP